MEVNVCISNSARATFGPTVPQRGKKKNSKNSIEATHPLDTAVHNFFFWPSKGESAEQRESDLHLPKPLDHVTQ